MRIPWPLHWSHFFTTPSFSTPLPLQTVEKDSPWERQRENLIYNHKITLLEALTGFEFRIKHLDDRILIVKSEPDTVVKPGDIKVYVFV